MIVVNMALLILAPYLSRAAWASTRSTPKSVGADGRDRHALCDRIPNASAAAPTPRKATPPHFAGETDGRETNPSDRTDTGILR